MHIHKLYKMHYSGRKIENREKKIKVIEVSSMEELGKMAGIEVKAATAAE